MNARLIREDVRGAAPGEKTKDTLGDAESEKTKKRAEYILISSSRGGDDKDDVAVYRQLHVTPDVSIRLNLQRVNSSRPRSPREYRYPAKPSPVPRASIIVG